MSGKPLVVPEIEALLVDALGETPGSAGHDAALDVIETAYRTAALAWPTLQVTLSGFAAAILKGFKPEGRSFAEHVEHLAVPDLYLTRACLEGDAQAINHFSTSLLPAICRSLERSASVGSEEVSQILRARFLVTGPGQPAPLMGYRGDGPLVRWLRSAALRTFFAQKRERDRRAKVEHIAISDAVVRSHDIELDVLRRIHSKDFQAAFESTFAALTLRDRTLLRMHVVEGMTIDEIGELYRTHRTTAFRWVEAARSALAKGVRRALAQKFSLTKSELDSFMRLVDSDELSLNRLLMTSLSPGK